SSSATWCLSSPWSRSSKPRAKIANGLEDEGCVFAGRTPVDERGAEADDAVPVRGADVDPPVFQDLLLDREVERVQLVLVGVRGGVAEEDEVERGWEEQFRVLRVLHEAGEMRGIVEAALDDRAVAVTPVGAQRRPDREAAGAARELGAHESEDRTLVLDLGEVRGPRVERDTEVALVADEREAAV